MGSDMNKKEWKKKKAIENHSKCLCINDQNENYLGALINDVRESGVTLDPENFDNAVKNRCCEYCQAGWESSKSIRIIKKIKGNKAKHARFCETVIKRKKVTQYEQYTRLLRSG